MAYTYAQIIEALGPPAREESRTIPRAQRREPIVIARAELFYPCGCWFSLKAFGGLYLPERHCATNHFR